MSGVLIGEFAVQQLRRQLGLGPQQALDLKRIEPEAFKPTFQLTASCWPDFSASDAADWPSQTYDVSEAEEEGRGGDGSSGADVALLVAFTGILPPLPPSLDVLLLRHQTGGHLAGEFRCAAIRLDLSEQGATLGNTIAERWHSTGAALGWVPFEDLFEYRTLLQEFGVDCNESYRHFAEGVYPIDLDDEALETLAIDGDALLRELSPDALSGACLVFLAPNSA